MSLLAELQYKLKNVAPTNINIDENPLAVSAFEIKEAKVISTYNYHQFELSDEDLKAVCVVSE